MHSKNYPALVFFSAILLFFFMDATSQVSVVRSTNKVIIEGKVYYLHVVKAGQTIYSVSKAYNISEKDINKENPGAESGLHTGQVLKIPADKSKEITLSVAPPPDTLYQQHEVKPGETMYSISKSYKVDIKELERVNPLIVNDEIKVGQFINVPRGIHEDPPLEFTFHKVKRRETIFGIAKMYNISEEDLKNFNPGLSEKTIKPGQLLKIPETIEIVKVADEVGTESLDSVPVYEGFLYDTIKIANKYSYYLDSMPDFKSRAFNVAYLLPFNFRKIEEIAPVEEEQNTLDDFVNIDHEFNPNDQMLNSRNFLEFLEGSLLAIDSLRNEGVSVNIFIFDTKKSTTRTREIISSPQFKKMDLIIGPFYSYNVEIVSEFSRFNKIPMISPLSGEDGPVAQNPYFFQLNPGYKTEFKRISAYVSNFSDKNIVCIHGIDSLASGRIDFLKENLNKDLSIKSPLDSIFFQDIAYDYNTNPNLSQDLLKVLSPEKENIIIVPETDEAFVGTVMTQLYFQLKSYKISVIGMSHWNTFQNIDYLYFHKLQLQYFTPYYFSYDSSNVKHFLKDYRNNFYSEPVTFSKKGASYAFLGYDISFHFLKIMNFYGKRFILHLNESNGHEIMNDFQFVQVSPESGFENHSLILVKFYEDLRIKAERCSANGPEE